MSNILYALLLGTFILVIAVLIFGDVVVQIHNEQCCKSPACSDTYFDTEKSVCVLTLCEHNPFIENKSKCEYAPLSVLNQSWSR